MVCLLIQRTVVCPGPDETKLTLPRVSATRTTLTTAHTGRRGVGLEGEDMGVDRGWEDQEWDREWEDQEWEEGWAEGWADLEWDIMDITAEVDSGSEVDQGSEDRGGIMVGEGALEVLAVGSVVDREDLEDREDQEDQEVGGFRWLDSDIRKPDLIGAHDATLSVDMSQFTDDPGRIRSHSPS